MSQLCFVTCTAETIIPNGLSVEQLQCVSSHSCVTTTSPMSMYHWKGLQNEPIV